MSTDNQDIDVIIEDDADKAKDPVVEVIDDKPAEARKELPADEGLEALKQNLADATQRAEQDRAARIEAERRAQEATATADRATTEVHETNVALVENAISTVKANQDALKGRLREARASGDVDAEADILSEISANGARLVSLEQGKAALEQAPKTTPRQQQDAPTDPVEHLARQLTPRSAAWVRAHPEYARDERKYAAMIGAHNVAVNGQGIAADSDEYFRSIETTLRIAPPSGEESQDALSGASQGAQRRSASPPAAPPSRSGDPANPRPGTVRLTAAEVEIAEMNGMTPAEYAKNKLALQREGKLH